MTLLKTVAELRLVQQCQDVTGDLGRAVCLRKPGLKGQVPTFARALSDFLASKTQFPTPARESQHSRVAALWYLHPGGSGFR